MRKCYFLVIQFKPLNTCGLKEVNTQMITISEWARCTTCIRHKRVIFPNHSSQSICVVVVDLATVNVISLTLYQLFNVTLHITVLYYLYYMYGHLSKMIIEYKPVLQLLSHKRSFAIITLQKKKRKSLAR